MSPTRIHGTRHPAPSTRSSGRTSRGSNRQLSFTKPASLGPFRASTREVLPERRSVGRARVPGRGSYPAVFEVGAIMRAVEQALDALESGGDREADP